MNQYVVSLGERAKVTSRQIMRLSTQDKNRGLMAVADELIHQSEFIINENQKDLAMAAQNNMALPLKDRLLLTTERVAAMAEGIRQIADLNDPIGEVLSLKTRPNGLQIGQKLVPLGVIGIIYESRPNVTADAFALCFKTSNAVILRGGSDAIFSNQAIVQVIQAALVKENLPADAILLVEDISRQVATEMMQLRQYIDVLIPRGSAGLIASVVENATIPVIETGTGNCHVYVDEYANLEMAVAIIENAKTSRLGVCNACESLVIHEKVASDVLPAIVTSLQSHQIVMYGDKQAQTLAPQLIEAQEGDWAKEYLGPMISIKTVASIEQAITHINQYNSGHSEAIITEHYQHAMQFLDEVDAAAVYVNASTRWTDGYEFGFGAEIGISTQKLHARGPMGLEALTSTKYIILGNGQIRE